MQWNTTANKTLLYVTQPRGSAKGLPVVAFMHGTASLFAMYSPRASAGRSGGRAAYAPHGYPESCFEQTEGIRRQKA